MSVRITLIFALAMGCDGPMTVDGGFDAGRTTDAGRDAGMPQEDAGMTDAGPVDAGPPLVRLTVCNFLSWCAVSVDGAAASTQGTIRVDVPAGTVVSLMGDHDGSGAFVWGYWQNTDGDPGPPDFDVDMAATVTVNDDIFVQACCPFATDPNTPCSGTAQPVDGPCL